MVRPRFPRVREDGSLAVAACFQPVGLDGRAEFERYLQDWLVTPSELLRLDVVEELGANPVVVDAEDGVVRVVFEVKPGSRFWKDILIRFTADAKEATTAAFKGFFDVVAGSYHRGSLQD